MCGIAGIVDFEHPSSPLDALQSMVGLLGHRGPDAAGIFLDGPVGMALTRLSIIDVAGGDQPLCNEDETVWVVFNGEIFNYPELRNRLQGSGHSFSTSTDTEVIVHLYEDMGAELVHELNGQFAFAIWDARRQRLCLGRDRFGIRPLFYAYFGKRLVFASEIKAIFAEHAIPRSLDRQTLSDILICWSPEGESTAFENIKQIPPASIAFFDKHGFTRHQYWRIPFAEPRESGAVGSRGLDDLVGELQELLTDAVRIRLRADVPVGGYLSGGLDSTVICSLIRNNFNNRLKTFSVSFADPKFDESFYQERALKGLAADHSSVRISAGDIGAILPEVVWHTEAPILRTAPAPLLILSRLVQQQGFKVVLTGEGADEMFAGYNIFKEDKVRRFWAREPNSSFRHELLRRLYPYVFTRENNQAAQFAKAYFKRGMTDLDNTVYSHLLRWSNTSQIRRFFTKALQEATDGLEDFILRVRNKLPTHFLSLDSLSRAQYLEISMFLSNYLLSSQGDRMAMANSVEGRYPFLDHRVVELAAKIPPKYRLNGLKEKYVLKKAAQGLVAQDLIDRPKQPYRAPISSCFLGEGAPEYVQELMSETALRRSGVFDSAKVQQLLAKCRKQGSDLMSERENMALVGILSTQLLDHQFIQGRPVDRSVQRADTRVLRPQERYAPVRRGKRTRSEQEAGNERLHSVQSATEEQRNPERY